MNWLCQSIGLVILILSWWAQVVKWEPSVYIYQCRRAWWSQKNRSYVWKLIFGEHKLIFIECKLNKHKVLQCVSIWLQEHRRNFLGLIISQKCQKNVFSKWKESKERKRNFLNSKRVPSWVRRTLWLQENTKETVYDV